MIVIFKLLVAKELALDYELPVFDILLPTGADCIIESVLRYEDVTDEYGCTVDIVDTSIRYLLFAAIPYVGLIFLCLLFIYRCKLMYLHIIPTLDSKVSDWARLFYCIAPGLFYFKLWKDWRRYGGSGLWKDEEISGEDELQLTHS